MPIGESEAKPNLILFYLLNFLIHCSPTPKCSTVLKVGLLPHGRQNFKMAHKVSTPGAHVLRNPSP